MLNALQLKPVKVCYKILLEMVLKPCAFVWAQNPARNISYTVFSIPRSN